VRESRTPGSERGAPGNGRSCRAKNRLTPLIFDPMFPLWKELCELNIRVRVQWVSEQLGMGKFIHKNSPSVGIGINRGHFSKV
jgi:hypothetical protein